jgi:mRNA interferase RelE/StbE
VSREIVWGRRARREVQAIASRDPQAAERLESAVAAYADRDQGDVRKMAGGSGVYRLRVGDWRVLFTYDDGGRIMAIARVLNRRDAYRG